MIQIKVINETNRFINKCIKNNINIYNIDYHKDYILVNIDENDYKTIKKLNYYSNISINKYYGINKIKTIIKKYKYDYLLLIIFLFIIYILSNVIVSIDIINESNTLNKEINIILKENNIKKYTFRKNIKELNKISDSILKNNRDILDFISIKKDGMKYIVRYEERIIKKIKEENNYCNIIAKKEGTITKIINTNGITSVIKGQNVKAGDVLITGEIKLNDEIKANTCANGIIMANTWYKVTIEYPMNKEIIEYTKNKQYNLKINNKYLFKQKYTNKKDKTIFKIKNIRFIKSNEYIIKNINYTKEEATKLAIEEAKNKLLDKIGKNNTIIDQKVLKESINNSKIELELFIDVNESIGELEYYKVGE